MDDDPEVIAEGSSPRVRGRQVVRCAVYGQSGLIPASAGQTVRLGVCSVIVRAHPRECGADPRVT